jgi:hypothetical protein
MEAMFEVNLAQSIKTVMLDGVIEPTLEREIYIYFLEGRRRLSQPLNRSESGSRWMQHKFVSSADTTTFIETTEIARSSAGCSPHPSE